jgi:hypothetical protein
MVCRHLDRLDRGIQEEVLLPLRRWQEGLAVAKVSSEACLFPFRLVAFQGCCRQEITAGTGRSRGEAGDTYNFILTTAYRV